MNVHACPVCGGEQLTEFVRQSGVPVHQNLVMSTREAARSVVRGDLSMMVCHDCGFVFNGSFDLSRMAYGSGYDNTQSCSPYFEAYLNDLAESLTARFGVRGGTIVEVGCGKGHFLRKLVSASPDQCMGFGFDPSYVGPETDLGGRLRFSRSYYDSRCAEVPADIVVCRHVIEHVPDPMALLRAVYSALRTSSHARVFFETPCVEWILRNQVVWDFFYEHCSLFSAQSLSTAFALAGFEVESVGHAFGGQYLWLEARVGEKTSVPVVARSEMLALARAYETDEARMRSHWINRLRFLKAAGPVALWGAGAKGVTIANLVDPDCTLIDCIVDINPNKQGCYLPGTGHPIIGPCQLDDAGVQSAILTNPNYRDEISRLLSEAGTLIELIDWSE
ncbi:MAG: methyltransferase domain-containing protein [Rhodocyclaceae bacterium]|nr:methyltransferase domain-containing protein [Rhodocyclaceae bacterium]